jgi:hypothetical protein
MTRGRRFGKRELGSFQVRECKVLDVRITPSLHERMIRMGLAPIPDAEIDVRCGHPPCPTQLCDKSPATKLIQ